MATTLDDVQSGIAGRSKIAGRGWTRGFGTGSQYATGASSIGGVPGNPIQGEPGWAPGAIFLNPLGTFGNLLWENAGTNLSASWVVMDTGVAGPAVTLTATTTLTQSGYAGRNIRLANAAGFTVNLPAATGSGAVYRFFTATTGGPYLIDAKPGGAAFSGQALMLGGQFGTVAGNNLITLNGTTTGGVAGDMIVITDLAANLYGVTAHLNNSAAAATPFSTH